MDTCDKNNEGDDAKIAEVSCPDSINNDNEDSDNFLDYGNDEIDVEGQVYQDWINGNVNNLTGIEVI